jgi:hypothetical protein
VGERGRMGASYWDYCVPYEPDLDVDRIFWGFSGD